MDKTLLNFAEMLPRYMELQLKAKVEELKNEPWIEQAVIEYRKQFMDLGRNKMDSVNKFFSEYAKAHTESDTSIKQVKKVKKGKKKNAE